MSTHTAKSPRITRVSWGKMEIEGGVSGKDFIVFPGGATPWDWNATGTQHKPGIQPANVESLLEHGCETVVLSRGMYRRLQVCPETLALLAERGVTVHTLETKEAVAKYNELAEQGAAVGGLFHTTC